MKTLNLTIVCKAVYNSHIDVPDEMTLEEAIAYAKKHLNECNIETELEYISDSDELDEENCDFVEYDEFNEKITYTVHLYDEDEILDMTQFTNKDKAIEYAESIGAHEVVNDNTGEIVYQK